MPDVRTASLYKRETTYFGKSSSGIPTEKSGILPELIEPVSVASIPRVPVMVASSPTKSPNSSRLGGRMLPLAATP